MKTKKVIFIRHGDYINVEPFDLSEVGKDVVRKLAINLISEIKGKEAVFLTSVANRAVQTAKELEDIWFKNNIDVWFHQHYELWSGSDARKELQRLKQKENKIISVEDYDWLDDFICSCTKEVVVIVSHFEVTKFGPRYLGFPFFEIPKGQARVLDLESKRDWMVPEEDMPF